ncbi:hypothetical protein PTTG_26174 [Puccinia triticina 1-1 BBBD Race 1]|uniref:Uncharacterized protein n=1 Tax=Puccinia triticina (isolate 1-1 / race 1 (BBBD)) TaxID=630390 RepID=A0A180GWH8_PUCT1|nr:hypothetical protein PTTG_26174 [Puccinia triticina 1-1 BBBD Race 1]
MLRLFPLQPPLPRTRCGSTVYFPLIDPPILFSFGGLFDGILQGDLYSFSFDPDASKPNLTAKVVATRVPAPTPRSDPLLAAADGHLFIWAGITNTDCAEQDTQLYSLSLSTSSWSRYKVSGACPAARFGLTTAIFKGFSYIYAGTNMNRLVHDSLWRIDLDHLTSNVLWEEISSPCNPAARTGHSDIVYDCAWLVFGGSSGRNVFNDTWKYNFSHKSWKSISCSGSLPPPRQLNHSALRLGERMFVFGGVDGENTSLCDAWALDLLSYLWYEVALEGSAEILKIAQLTAAWDETIYVLGGSATTPGLPLTPSLYHTLDCSQTSHLSTSSDSQLVFGALRDTIVVLPLELYPTNDPP